MGLWDEFAPSTSEDWFQAILSENKGVAPKTGQPFYTRDGTVSLDNTAARRTALAGGARPLRPRRSPNAP